MKWSAGPTQKAVIGVKVLDVHRGEELMFDEHGGRHYFAGKNVQRKTDDALSILFGEVGDRSDQPRARYAQFATCFRLAVLSDDGAFADSPGLGFAQMLAHPFKDSLELPVAVDINGPALISGIARHAENRRDRAI